MRYTLGIDLGTTISVMAVVDETGSPVVLKNAEGSTTTPSVIYLGEDEPLVGEQAKEYQAYGYPEIAAFFKRVMGDSNFQLEFNGKTYNTIELSSYVLKKLKDDAEIVLGQPITDAVITVPAYFNNHQREATMEAGKMAGLHVLRIINEPTAAAIAYGIRDAGSKSIMVYDLGGGTFDVTVASFTDSSIDVLATEGDHSLGGKDWDDCLAVYVSEKFNEEFGIDPLEDDDAFNSILVSCEKAKKQLSARSLTTISVVHEGRRGKYEITKELFEDLTSHLVERTWGLSIQALENANLNGNTLDEIILVGGSTRMPMISKFIEEKMGKKPKTGLNVDEAVACGAAIQASIEAENKGIAKKLFTIGSIKRVKDVMSHSLGMVAINDDQTKYINDRIISKNTSIPITEKRPYQLKTKRNGNNILEIYVTQGESDRPLDCSILGKYVVSDITHVENGPAVIDVSYSYDENGVVNVTASEKSTKKQLPIIIEKIPKDLSWLDASPNQYELITESMSILIAVDLSYSMKGKPLQEAQKAAYKFVEDMDLEHTSVGLIGFANSSAITLPLSQSDKEIKTSIDQFETLLNRGALGYANEGEPFTDTHDLLSKVEGPRYLIVLTDGIWDSPKVAIKAAEKCHASGIEVIAIGFGSANEKFLKKIATTDENALSTDLTQVVSSFSKIAQILSETNRSSNGALQFFK